MIGSLLLLGFLTSMVRRAGWRQAVRDIGILLAPWLLIAALWALG